MIRNLQQTVGNYQLVRLLGQGGMGAVYEGIDTMLQRPVAIKMLRPEIAQQPELIDRFRAEAVTLARLHHPNIATLYAFFREQDEYFMVMEFVEGKTLEAVLAEHQRLDPRLAADVTRQILDAMAHANKLGVLHRDIKPANVMLSPAGEVKVTDFGIARLLGSARMTQTGHVLGTLAYLSPERIRGEEADIRSDIYSTGILLYETIAGRLPFVSDTDYGLMQAHLTQPPPPLPATGCLGAAELEGLVRRAIAKRPEDRFSTAEEFRDALAALAPSVLKPTRLATAAVAVEPPPAPRRRLAWIGGAAALLIAILAGVGFWLWPRPQLQPAQISQPPASPLAERRSEVPIVLPPVTAAPAPSGSAVAAAAPAIPASETSRTSSLRSIRGVRRLYIEELPNELDHLIAAEIGRRLGQQISVVSSRGQAQAVLSGSADKKGRSRLAAGFRDSFAAEVAISDINTGKSLWTAQAGDRQVVLGVVKSGGPKKVAERLVSQLEKAVSGR